MSQDSPQRRYDDGPVPLSPRHSTTAEPLDAVPLSPSLPSHPIAPDARPYIRVPKALHHADSREKQSLLDELIPTPRSATAGDSEYHVLRRTGALAVIIIFFLSTVFLACTTEGLENTAGGLRKVFGSGSAAGVGGAGWVAQDLNEGGEASTASSGGATENATPEKQFEQYTFLRTIPAASVDIGSKGKRLIFIGDVHGSYEPLRRLMDKLGYRQDNDVLIHVGDLVAKGEKNNEVLGWMAQRRVLGVRGNHDQPVIQWRAWMEWAGGTDWEAFMDSLSAGGESEADALLQKHGKTFPKGWDWKGEHWHLARNLAKHHYAYLIQLPLLLHLPSMHTIVVHAGILPSDPRRSANDVNQPLIEASHSTSSPNYDASLARNSEEVSILLDVPQNTKPWNLLNMRGVYFKGKHQGEVSKSSKKGKPWSEVWKKEMKRCKGPGAWFADGMGEWGAEHDEHEDEGTEGQEDGEGDELVGQERRDDEDDMESDLKCSPVTVIYGHAAGRGLDVKPFSKGIDTGCVYGRQLTALVLGNLTGLQGESVRVGDEQGILVNVECGKGGV